MSSAAVFPPTKNSIALAEVSSDLSGWALVLVRYVYACFLAPIVEELVFRDLVMTALAPYQKYKLDMLVSALLVQPLACLAAWLGFAELYRSLGTGPAILCGLALYRIDLLVYPSACLLE